MMSSIHAIKKILGFDVFFLCIRTKDESGIGDYINAYVRLPGAKKLGEDLLDWTTYDDGDIVGIDTAHAHNMGTDLEERYKDAQNQIRKVIRHYKRAKNQ